MYKRTFFQRKQVYLSQQRSFVVVPDYMVCTERNSCVLYVHSPRHHHSLRLPLSSSFYHQHDCSTDSQINEFENLSGPFSQDYTNTAQRKHRRDVYMYNITVFTLATCSFSSFVKRVLVPLLLMQTIFCVLLLFFSNKICTYLKNAKHYYYTVFLLHYILNLPFYLGEYFYYPF